MLSVFTIIKIEKNTFKKMLNKSHHHKLVNLQDMIHI